LELPPWDGEFAAGAANLWSRAEDSALPAGELAAEGADEWDPLAEATLLRRALQSVADRCGTATPSSSSRWGGRLTGAAYDVATKAESPMQNVRILQWSEPGECYF